MVSKSEVTRLDSLPTRSEDFSGAAGVFEVFLFSLASDFGVDVSGNSFCSVLEISSGVDTADTAGFSLGGLSCVSALMRIRRACSKIRWVTMAWAFTRE